MRYFKRKWDESRGDERDSWGTSTWYLEVGDDGYPVRQVEVYNNGAILKYGEVRLDDEFGGLGDQSIDFEEFVPFEIEPSEFETVWTSSIARSQ